MDESGGHSMSGRVFAIVLMFFCGWSLAKYVGSNKWLMSFGLTLVGIVLVLITIALGG